MGNHVRDRDRFSIIQPSMDYCIICGKKDDGTLEKHEVFHGTAFRRLSKDWGMVVALCPYCHRLGRHAVHKNRKVDLSLKQTGQKVFEKHYGHDKYMEVFRRNYL